MTDENFVSPYLRLKPRSLDAALLDAALLDREGAQRRAIAVNIATTTPDVMLGPLTEPVTLRQSLPFWLAFASVVWVALYLILYYAL